MKTEMQCLVRRVEGDLFVVSAEGAEIPVGTVFTTLTKERLDGESSTFTQVDLGVVGQVRLEVKEVRWPHRQQADFVPSGHSAGLKLEGAGLDLLKKSLDSLLPREYLALKTGETDRAKQTL